MDVTAENWIDPPYNRVGFRRVERLTRTLPISRGSRAAVEIPFSALDLDGFEFHFQGDSSTLPMLLDVTYADAFVVLHNDEIVIEWYSPEVAPSDTHLLMSISKSMTSVLCGVLVGRGLLKTSDEVTRHIDELRGTSWEGCTVQNLLDMRTGTEWVYDRDEVDILDVSAYRTRRGTGPPATTAEWIRSIRNSRDHGGAFRYVSLVADVLGWILERAGGAPFPELFSEHVWSQIGAEADAAIIVDTGGFPVTEGGICATPRDVARFGQMCLRNGEVGGRQVVPSEWLEGLRHTNADLIEAFAQSPEFDPQTQEALYHDNWWIQQAERGVYAGLGIHGQVLWIDHAADTVVVKLSSQPEPENSKLAELETAGLRALCSYIAGA